MTTELNPMTDEDIEEQLRQLEIEDGDETIEHADTQYSDYPEVDNTVQSIKVKYSDDSMWGNEGSKGYDVKASYAKFEEMVTAKLSEMYPGAEVEFENGINDSYAVDGDRSGDEVPWVQQAVGKVWESFDWAIENAN